MAITGGVKAAAAPIVAAAKPGPVADDVAKVAKDAVDDAAKAVKDEADEAAKAVKDAAKDVTGDSTRKLSNAGWLGYGAGAAGIVITLLNTWKDALGSDGKLDASGLFGNGGMSILGGAVLLTIGEKSKVGGAGLSTVMRGAGVALVGAGLIGAVGGAVQRFGKQDAQNTDTRIQQPTSFTTDLPPTPDALEGMTVAWADAMLKDGNPTDIGIYIETDTAKALPQGTTIGEAIGEAHALTQQDKKDLLYRSHAVIQTKDGTYWTVRLSGDLDQVDGRSYTKGNELDPYRVPLIGKYQASLQAISGVESVYVFPAGMGATEPPQAIGDVPWIAPDGSTSSTSPTGSTTDGDADTAPTSGESATTANGSDS